MVARFLPQGRVRSSCRWRNRSDRHKFLCCRGRCMCQRKPEISAAQRSPQARAQRRSVQSEKQVRREKSLEEMVFGLSWILLPPDWHPLCTSVSFVVIASTTKNMKVHEGNPFSSGSEIGSIRPSKKI